MRNMLLQDKRGLSIMVGYVLLVVIGIVMSVFVYQWIKTYVPKESLECPDGVSIFVKEIVYNCEDDTLTLTVRNNGLFNVAGYYLRATENSEQELATLDLSENIQEGESSGAQEYAHAVIFTTGENIIEVDEEKTTIFDLNIAEGNKIELIPVMFQKDDRGKKEFVTCSDGRIEQALSCSAQE